jgi:hypothetical protein
MVCHKNTRDGSDPEGASIRSRHPEAISQAANCLADDSANIDRGPRTTRKDAGAFRLQPANPAGNFGGLLRNADRRH